VLLEDGIPEPTARELAARGHDVFEGVSGFERSVFGRGQVIRREADGSLTAGSDPRADGSARAT
jgi:gamma-glutamyltranspeptidase/glutathione hydrolase